jgi:hypothetical protein
MEVEYIDGVGLVHWRLMEYQPGDACLEVIPQESRWEINNEAPVLRIPLEHADHDVEVAKGMVLEGLQQMAGV